jgi:cytochrome P450/NADPH-cytochrome P450 reductase
MYDFTVFGAGNHDWVNTYQKIPKLCDDLLAQFGGQRILERGEGDAGSAKFFSSFDAWEGQFWAALSRVSVKHYSRGCHGLNVVLKLYDVGKADVAGLQMKVVEPITGRAAALRQGDLDLAVVLDNQELTSRGPTKLHLELELPEGMTYQSGDYLAMSVPVISQYRGNDSYCPSLPVNPVSSVHRVLVRFGLSGEQEVSRSTTPVFDVLIFM